MTLEDLFLTQTNFAPGAQSSQPSLVDLLNQIQAGPQNMRQLYNQAEKPTNFFKDPQVKAGTGQTDIMQLLQDVYGPDFRGSPEVLSILSQYNNELTAKIGFENLGKVLNSGRAAANYIKANQGLGLGGSGTRIA